MSLPEAFKKEERRGRVNTKALTFLKTFPLSALPQHSFANKPAHPKDSSGPLQHLQIPSQRLRILPAG